jgi:hypothetical protein
MSHADDSAEKPYENSSSIQKAEEAVQNSINRFEAAMEKLTEKIEGTTQKIHHVRQIAHDSKGKLMQLKNEVQTALGPIRPYAKQVALLSVEAVSLARRAKRPYLWIAVGVAGYMAYKYFSRKNEAVPQES